MKTCQDILEGGGGGIIGGVVVGSTFVIVKGYILFADELEEAANHLIAWVGAQLGEEIYQNHSVYVLIDENNIVRYVGRTVNPTLRKWQHNHDISHPWRKDYDMKVLITGLSLDEARFYEQVLISAFARMNIENARREIAVKNLPKFWKYVAASIELLLDFPASTIYRLTKSW